MLLSMKKKEVLIILILILLVGGGILVWQYWLAPKYGFPLIEFPPKLKEQVPLATDKTEYEQGERVKVVVKNNSTKEKCISPDFEIENFRIKWEKIRKVWCHCEAICSLQQCENLKPGEVKEFGWNQKESWCSGPQGHSETVYQQAPSGIYRVKIQTNEGIIYSNEFTIKEKKPGGVGGSCAYSSYPGECTITRIEKTEKSKKQAETPKCGYEGYEVRFTFKTDREIEKKWVRKTVAEQEDNFILSGCRCTYPGPRYLEKYHIEVGSGHECALRAIESGTCTPIRFEFEQIKRNDCFECL